MKTGRIFQINASNGGVPKLPIRASDVDHLGLKTDAQKSNPGWARAYTKVVKTGCIQVGDPIEIFD